MRFFPFQPRLSGVRTAAFSLVELMVGSALLLTILGILVTMVNMTTALWNSTTGGVQDYQRARQAFDILTARLSQATLNTYWGCRYDANENPIEYVRQSELRFVCDQASSFASGSAALNPGKAVFFQAPGGINTSGSLSLHGALNSWGYFVEYGSDGDYLPEFFTSERTAIEGRYRFRLIEVVEPKNKLSIFKYTADGAAYGERDWVGALLSEPKWKRIVAENVVALVLLPKLSPSETADRLLAPKYSYDSSTATDGDAIVNSKNQLPPLVEVTMVVVDERSVARHTWTSTPPDFGMDQLFLDASKQREDLDLLEQRLRSQGFQSRRFSVTVPLRGAKWSTQQSK